MKNIIEVIKSDVLNHIKDNYDLLLNEDAKITSSNHGTEDVRRLTYFYKQLLNGEWFDVAYDFKIMIQSNKRKKFTEPEE